MAAAYPRDTSRTAWLSRGFEVLVERVAAGAPNALHFDVLIIGSGYGGSVAAATLAGRAGKGGAAVRVGVLERGKEYLPGSFPVGLRELPGHIRGKRYKEGLFDIRPGPEVNTVVANGLGGGSLINAGVMEKPGADVFTQGWPAALANLAKWDAYYDTARELLGSLIKGAPNTILNHPDGVPQKYLSLQTIGTVRPAEITVAMADTASSGNVALKKCTRCGDCATGCNFGAKNSLDVNLLAIAHANGAEIFSGATVLGVRRDPMDATAWLVKCVHTSETQRSRDEVVKDQVVEVRATNVVLAAGTLGSTEILLRSQTDVQLSSMLGKRCSTNGDMLITDYATGADVHTVADEAVKPSTRAVGPTITGIIDVPKTTDRSRLTIEEMSVPAGLRLAFTETFATINTLHSLAEADSSHHDEEFPSDDIYAVSRQQIERSALYAVMGDDGAAGTIELNVAAGKALCAHDDGIARMRWPNTSTTSKSNALPDLDLFDQQVDALGELTQSTGGRLLPNPVWKLLPTDLEWLLGSKRGPLTTVHPLGGCAMADDATTGVVDDRGRVFSSSTGTAVHGGLVVLDGSVIPTAIRTNPSLTIAAVALRAAELLAGDWGYGPLPPAVATAAVERPVFRPTDTAFAPTQKTQVDVIERLVGRVEFKDDAGLTNTRVVELTLRFAPKDVTELARPPQDGGNPVLHVATDAGNGIASRIRIYDAALWDLMELQWTPDKVFEKRLESMSLFSAPLSGSLKVFERQKSMALARRVRASLAWWGNRGKRDTNAASGDDGGPDWLSRIKAGWALASRAGEERALIYDLTVGNPDLGAVFDLRGPTRRILGRKTFTYARRANPWRQLMEVELEEFPGLKGSTDERILKLDTRYLARIGVPLFRIVGQNDGVTALADSGSFLGYFVRLLLGIHIWSFRAPDIDPTPPPINRLPTKDPGGPLPPPVRFEIPLPADVPAGGTEAYEDGKVIVTHFAQPVPDPTKFPLVMLHGYSASGTTFAHESVTDNYASYFYKKGRDIWIADLRTSSGQASAVQPWSFEQIGRMDVPMFIHQVLTDTGASKVDVLAHCMGTVVFSIAALDKASTLDAVVNRVAFTQVGPLVVFSPANQFRGYVMRYFVDFLPENYRFKPDEGGRVPTLADDLYDRLLSTLPYPVEEYDVENPPGFTSRTPWTRTRHRMDALYGRDFNAANMEPEMLRHIDDHFGPLSLRTVAQTLNFVRYSLITDYHGHNDFVSRQLFKDKWPFPTLSVHGAANGLAHVSTVDRMRVILEDAGRVHQHHIIDNAGHQDALVGDKRSFAQDAIETFLASPGVGAPTTPSETRVAYTPWIGPIVTEQRDVTQAAVIRLASAPMHRAPEGVVMIRVSIAGDRLVRPDDPTQPWDVAYIMAHAAFYTSSTLITTRWDAFEAPLPTQMPGYQPGDNIGDGLLVLIIYAESPLLAPPQPPPGSAYYFKTVGTTVVPFTPTPGITPAGVPPLAIAPPFLPPFPFFQRVASALLTSLQKQPLAATEGRLAARDAPGHPVLVSARTTARLELPKVVTMGVATSALLSFGTNVDAATAGAIGETIDQDDEIRDGVVLYDPPTAPPATPDPAGTRFALVCCQYPGGLLDGPVAYASYRRALERFQDPPAQRPRFAVFTGDQVYVDPTAGLYDPNAYDGRYDRPYELWLRQHAVRSVLRRVPSFMLLDDHEITDNWEPLPAATPEFTMNQNERTDGLAAYDKFQRGMPPTSTSFEFRFDGFPFFMLDTRSERDLRTVGSLAGVKLFKAATLTRLTTFLKSDAAKPRFVVTPSMFLPRHRRAVQHALGASLDAPNPGAIWSDGWDGYPESLRAVLGILAENSLQHVVFLSGDEHRGCVARIVLTKAGVTVATAHSIHAAAANAPFTFANGLAEDFVDVDVFQFTYNSVAYQCTVTITSPTTRDGATMLRPWRDASAAGNWHLDYEYTDGGVQTLTI